ncbi:MAG: hypothetical protein QXL17_07810 [Candidatus Thermoplasmatota archaeon]
MKYRDLITVFTSIGFFLTLGYAAGVNHLFWFLPVILGVLLVLIYLKLWR